MMMGEKGKIIFAKFILPSVEVPEHNFTKYGDHGFIIELINDKNVEVTPESWCD